MVKFGGTDSWIQFDQHIPRLDRCAIANMNRAHYARFGRLDHLGPAIHNDLSRRGCYDVDLAQRRPAQRRAEQQDNGQADGAAYR